MSGLFSMLLLCAASSACATPAQVWQQAMQRAAGGHVHEAKAYLAGAEASLPVEETNWRARMRLGIALLDMREHQILTAPVLQTAATNPWMEVQLIAEYLKSHAQPAHASTVMPGLLAALLPGAGHAWQGRWRDAGVAAMLVWPMLILSLWAARRRMGPVTVFFALITVWLWSGTVYSSVSLAERGNLEAYLVWWQGMWMSSGLPGRPW